MAQLLHGYSSAFLGKTQIGEIQETIYDVDFVTVNPYMGTDCIKPFIQDCKKYNKGIFVLVKTSNPSSGELQDLKLENGKEVYIKVSELVEKWGEELRGENGYSSVAAVVGATYPEQLEQIRIAKRHFTIERKKHLQRAWELDLPVKDYIDEIKRIDAKKAQEERREQSLKDFLITNLSDEELKERQEIHQRLEELNKIVPRFIPNTDKDDSYEYVIKEIKNEMAKISFDKGKTFLDILNDRDNLIILNKISKMKVWENVVNHFDTDAMLQALEHMSANERKMCTQGNKAENRMLYLGKYLLEANTDLVL